MGRQLFALISQSWLFALVWVRAQEAIARECKYLTIDALPSSRPIVERLGFELLSMTIPYEFDGKTL